MGAAIPALGFASRTEAVLHLRSMGLRREVIAQRLDIEVKTVAALECSARRSREKTSAYARPSASTMPLSARQALRPHAARRGLSVDALIHQLIETIALSNLVDAVLDDAEELS